MLTLFWSYKQRLCLGLCSEIQISLNNRPTFFPSIWASMDLLYIWVQGYYLLPPTPTHCVFQSLQRPIHTSWAECILPTEGFPAGSSCKVYLLFPPPVQAVLGKMEVVSSVSVFQCCWSWAAAASWRTRKTLLVLFGLVLFWQTYCPPFLYLNLVVKYLSWFSWAKILPKTEDLNFWDKWCKRIF